MQRATIQQLLGGCDAEVARIAAEFESPDEAAVAKAMIDELLDGAMAEVDELLALGGGQADSADVARIFAKHGLGENIDWGPHNSPAVCGDQMAWDVPASFDLEEAYTLLSALGAKEVALCEQVTEPWRTATYPVGMAMVEEECNCDHCEHVEIFDMDESFDRFDPFYSAMLQKRTLH